MDQCVRLLWLVPLGFFAAAYGTIIGAGGGFILAPTLLLLYPGELPETVTSISLVVVLFNALSGTLAYAKSRRVNYKLGTVFALGTAPGAILGAMATTAISRVVFNFVVALLLMLVAALLHLKVSGQASLNSAAIRARKRLVSNRLNWGYCSVCR